MLARFTAIQLTPETREKLKALWKKGESYEDIILALIAQNTLKRP